MCDVSRGVFPRAVPFQSADRAVVESTITETLTGAGGVFSPTLVSRMVAKVGTDASMFLLLCGFDQSPVGWTGLADYTGAVRPDRPLETYTFFVPDHRGLGLVSWCRCLQAHAAAGRPVVISIAEWNHRSLNATTRDARRQGWPGTPRLVEEPGKDRFGWVLEWPTDLRHHCFQQGLEQAAG